MSNKFIAAVVQIDTTTNYEDNMKAAHDFTIEAAKRGAALVTFSENWTYQGDDYLDYAEEMPGGKLFTMLSALAKQHHLWIHSGSSSRVNPDPNDHRPYNSSMLINPAGEMVARYDKIHVFDVDVAGAGKFRESDHKCPGKDVVMYDTKEIGKLGLTICYDMRFPELYRLLAMKGTDIFLAPSSFLLMTGKDHWDVLLQARAIENSCYMLAGAQCGVKYDGPTYGRSLIIDPWGTIIAKASDQACVITAEIDLDFRQKLKKQVITLENRREDVYSLSER